MGIVASIDMDTEEEVILLPPEVSLPLDISTFLSSFGWTQGVPPSLMEFYTLAKKLQQQLDRLPARNSPTPGDWISQSTKWSQGVLDILNSMHNQAHRLLEIRPADLRGNLHPVEEYRTDIESTTYEFAQIVKPLRNAIAGDTAKIEKALDDIRNIHMFRAFLSAY